MSTSVFPPHAAQVHAGKVHTPDGFALSVTRFEPETPAGKVVLIASATAVHQPYYQKFALFLAREGYTVYTFDYRGVGQSRPRSLKGFQASLGQWGKLDLETVIRHVRKHHPGAPLTYIGHSIGGQLLALTAESRHVSKVVLIASQLTFWGLWPWYAQLGYALLLHALLPLVSHVCGYFPGKTLGVFWDLPKAVALDIARWGRHRQGMFAEHTDCHVQKLRVPLLAISFHDDLIAPVRALRALLARYGQASLTWYHYSPWHLGVNKIGHLGFFRRKFSDTLWKQTALWLEQHP
jgi:predicted alpha/beta hydrolase